MKPVHPAIKILTATVFIILMSGFVAFRSGAFDGTKSATIKLHVSNTGKSHHRKENDPDKRAIYQELPPLTEEQERMRTMIHSSKTIVSAISVSDFRNWYSSSSMLSSSKFAVMVEPRFPGWMYKEAFTRPWPKKSTHLGGELKQGRK
jgi:hypothetical protein